MQPGQWSRPAEPLTRGVRPNSPQTRTQHALGRGRGRAGPRPGSPAPRRAAGAAGGSPEDLGVVVPAASTTVTNVTPASTSRRASRQPWPTRCPAVAVAAPSGPRASRSNARRAPGPVTIAYASAVNWSIPAIAPEASRRRSIRSSWSSKSRRSSSRSSVKPLGGVEVPDLGILGGVAVERERVARPARDTPPARTPAPPGIPT